jgi:hypothetical protein
MVVGLRLSRIAPACDAIGAVPIIGRWKPFA